MDKTSTIKKENQDALITNKKFNRVFEEYIDKDLSKGASNLSGDYWITLISVYDIFNQEIKDFEICNFLKKKATKKILKAQMDGTDINSLLGGTSDDFVDSMIYESFSSKNLNIFLNTVFSFFIGILSTLLLNLIFVFMGLLIKENAVYSGGYVYLNLKDFSLALAIFTFINPFIQIIKDEVEEKFNKIFSYISTIILTIFVTTLYLGIVDMVMRFNLFTIPINFGIYMLITFLLFIITLFLYKYIKK